MGNYDPSCSLKRKGFFVGFVKRGGGLDVVVQTCNPSTRDEGGRRIESLRLAWATHPKAFGSKRKKKKKLGVVVNSCNFNTQKVEAGEL